MHFQTAFSALVPKDGGQVAITNANSVYTWTRTLLPYTVPVACRLDITDVHFASKHVCFVGKPPFEIRSSYLVINNVLSVTEYGPTLSLVTPFRIPAGQKLEALFINNSPEDQWMNGFITGQLVRDAL